MPSHKSNEYRNLDIDESIFSRLVFFVTYQSFLETQPPSQYLHEVHGQQY